MTQQPQCLPKMDVVSQGNVKLAKFGLYHMTDHGADVDFPIGYVFFSSFITEKATLEDFNLWD